MMDIYLDNLLLECETPGTYKLELSNSDMNETVWCERVALMKLDTGYLLRITADIHDLDFEKSCRIKLYRGEEEMVCFRSVKYVTYEKRGTYRFYGENEAVHLCEQLQMRQGRDTESIAKEAVQENDTQVSWDCVVAMHEKYFAQKDVQSLLMERRKMRRRQVGASNEGAATNILGELDNMIGLHSVKLEIKKMIALEAQREFLNSIGMKEKPNDMLFLGNPGTGKTTVARYLTEVLHKMGKIRENKCVEINGHDLMGGYIGQTASTVDKYLREASGGMLFIDEAYSLLDGSDSFASDAITKLLGALTKPNRDYVCVLAGYEDEMNELMRFNAGFESRVATKLHFEDYTVEELGEIFCNLIKGYGYSMEVDALQAVLNYFASVIDAPKFSNGRFARNLFEKMEEEHCKHFDGMSEESDIFRKADLTEDIKRELIVGIM